MPDFYAGYSLHDAVQLCSAAGCRATRCEAKLQMKRSRAVIIGLSLGSHSMCQMLHKSKRQEHGSQTLTQIKDIPV